MAFQVVAGQNVVGAVAKPAAVEGPNSTKHKLLTMYSELPRGDITLEEFEKLALDRLRVLKGVEDIKLRNRSDQEVAAKVDELMAKHIADPTNNAETLRRDCVSHHILRLAYCRTPELRKWFLTQETELFKARFNTLLQTNTDKEDFLTRSGLSYTAMGDAEVTRLAERLRAVLASQGVYGNDNQTKVIGEGWFKVPWTAVPDLVAQRRVLLVGGHAAVSARDLSSLVVQDFRASVSKGLADINRRWRDMFPESDARLRPLVAGLSSRYLGMTDYAAAAQRHGAVTLANLPAVSQRHFPLCMQNLMSHLQADHHLRHNGRLQLTLFLKAVGLSMEDALLFFRTCFAPKMPGDKFDKDHAYNIRHSYGKEGARKNYSANTCTSLVQAMGGPADHHGCPFKRMDEANLRAALARTGCEPAKMEEAVAKAKAGHYQVACACAFEGVHKVPMDAGLNHPAEYYAESRRVTEEREGAAKGTSITQQQGPQQQGQQAASGPAAPGSSTPVPMSVS